ncbi:MAG: ABC transporter ATP-binding protein [Candidatus Diapherotrites archaeon]
MTERLSSGDSEGSASDLMESVSKIKRELEDAKDSLDGDFSVKKDSFLQERRELKGFSSATGNPQGNYGENRFLEQTGKSPVFSGKKPILNTVLSVESIVKRFGKRTVLNNVSFSFTEGTILGLLGPNGSGKSTLIKILSGFLHADSGSFSFKGETVGRSTASLKRHLGVVPQEEMFYRKFSVEENIAFFGMLYGLSGKRLEERKRFLLEWLGLKDFMKQKAENLSGGYRRLLNIACSIVHDPELVFLDEPTVGLDPKFRKLLWVRISEMRDAGKSVLITTHYMDEASRLCDEIVLLFSGKVLVKGKPQQLVREYGGNTAIMLSLESEPSESTIEKIKALVPGAVVRQKGNELFISVFGEGSIESAYKIDKMLKVSGERVVSFVLGEPTLEDVFFNIVGKAEGLKNAEDF